MAGFWDRLRGREPSDASGGDPLARLLSGYPPNRPHHVGDMASLGDAERDDNLRLFLAERDMRLGTVSAFLGDQGVAVASMLDPAGDGVAAAREVDAWLDRVLPRRPMTPLGDAEPNPPVAAFRRSDRSGRDIFYSLVADLALLEGEAIRLRDGRFDWGVNRLRSFRTMPSFNRICLAKPGAPSWDATVLDLHEHLLAMVHAKAAPSVRTGRRYGDLLDGAVRGAFDPR